MARHPDFQKIFDAFMQQYCSGSECTEGKMAYQTWLSKIGLDETKPYQRPQEKFAWAKDYIQFMKEDDKAKYFKIRALFPLTSMNNNLYTQHEIMTATKTLIGKPTNLNHSTEILPDVETIDADFEDKTVECIDRVPKGSKALQLLESGQIIHVSIEADCLRGSDPTPEGNLCRGLIFSGKAYLTKDVLPGVPLTTIEPLEKIVEGFKVMNLIEEKGKEQAPVEKTDPKNQESFGDASFPDNCFAFVPDSAKGPDGRKSDRKLPYKNRDGTVDLDHVRNALSRLDQTEGIPDAEKEKIRTMLQNILKNADPDYKPEAMAYDEFRAELDAVKQRLGDLDALKTQIQSLSDQIAKLAAEPESTEPEPKTEKMKEQKPCLCVLTKEGFWARFHQLRSEGLDKNDAFRLVSQEVIAAVEKKAQMQ